METRAERHLCCGRWQSEGEECGQPHQDRHQQGQNYRVQSGRLLLLLLDPSGKTMSLHPHHHQDVELTKASEVSHDGKSVLPHCSRPVSCKQTVSNDRINENVVLLSGKGGPMGITRTEPSVKAARRMKRSQRVVVFIAAIGMIVASKSLMLWALPKPASEPSIESTPNSRAEQSLRITMWV